MIDLTVYNVEGQEVDSLKVDEAVLGGKVRYPLLKQAIVMYHTNKRVGTASTKSRGMISGSTKKLFRQKGTGNARAGTSRTCKRVGGGVAFAKLNRNFRNRMPKKQRQLARDSAVLAKLLSNNVVVIDTLEFDEPKTKRFADILGKLKIERSCLITLNQYNSNVHKSTRNIPKVSIMPVEQLNAGDICCHQKMLFTREALTFFLNRDSSN